MPRPVCPCHGKIKWYVKALVFGGDPQSALNVIWVTHDQHAELVKYWNGVSVL